MSYPSVVRIGIVILPTAATVAGARTGDSTIKKTGDDNGTRHTCGEFSEEVCKNIKQFFGNTTFCHDDTGKDKHRNCKEREGVQTAEHGTDQIFGTYSKGRDQTRTEEQM